MGPAAGGPRHVQPAAEGAQMAMKTKEIQQNLVKTMQEWQGVERASIASTGAVIGKTTSPLIHLVMEIIQRDSQMHHRVQQFIVDSLESAPVAITPEDMREISAMIDAHLKLEEKMVGSVNAAIAQVRGKKMGIQEYLLNFLVEDEKKHENLLTALATIKSGLYKVS
jgi:hypothetical protein